MTSASQTIDLQLDKQRTGATGWRGWLVDEKDSLDDFIRLRAALADDALRTMAVRRYVAMAAQASPPAWSRR